MNIKLNDTQKIKVINSQDIYNIMQQILLRENKIDRDKEHFWLVCLANNNKILMIELISLGSVNATVVEPMDVFSFALQKRAVKLILVHNHPSGELAASTADLNITEKMFAIGKFVSVPVIDHLIISETGYMSFSDKGMIDKMEADNNYDLTFTQIDALKEQMKGIEKRKAEEMAKRMLEEGLSVEQVVRISGLTVKQVEKLGKK